MNDKLLFTTVPEKWEEYLPLGNGRLGCMVKTHPCNEIIQLNEEGIWSGGPQERSNPDTQKTLSKIRNLVKSGNVLEAQELGFETMSAMGFNERVYQTAGDFKIDFYADDNFGIECGWPLRHKSDQACIDSYKSVLDISAANCDITYTDKNGTKFSRRIWASAADDAIFMYVKAEKLGQINFRGYLDRGIWCDSVYVKNNFIFLEDSHGIPFCVGVGVVANGGKVYTSGFTLAGDNCNEVLFFIDINSWKWNKKNIDKKQYEKLIKKNVWSSKCNNKLLEIKKFAENHGVKFAVEYYFKRHLDEYKAYWNRMSLQIGEIPSCKEFDVTTPMLLKSASFENTHLVNTYANFARYLLISASRVPGELPITLQGLWNCYIDPPWGSKYTININAQMNYWPVNMAALSECEYPFFDLLERAYEKGCYVAKKMYACRGYVLHHNTDYWGDACPQDTWLPGTYWVLGAAWVSIHIWEHFEYTQNIAILKRYYYLIHESCRFFVDYLQPCSFTAEDEKPYLVINPSLSPENSYVTKTGQVGAFTEGSQMDNMILEHLFKSCLKAYAVLGNSARSKKNKRYNESEYADFEYVLNHLKPPSLNKDGSLMEWNTEVEEAEQGHRHISHLYGLFPGHTITVEKTPDLAEACKKTLTKRLAHGGGHTGWSQSWIINFRAQLEQGDEALKALVSLFCHSTLPNLLDNHPPFQIDGNFGSFAAIMRMLIQSEYNDDGTVYVKLLPALPNEKAWQTGFVRGIGIKGNWFLSFNWKNGKIENLELIPGKNAISKNKLKFSENTNL